MKRATAVYLVVNMIGLIFYLLVVLGIRDFARAEHRNYYDFGDSLNFIIWARPVWLAAGAYSCFWGIRSLLDRVLSVNAPSSSVNRAAIVCVGEGGPCSDDFSTGFESSH